MVPTRSANNTTILLLISDQLVLLVIQGILEREGYLVLPTRDLGAALERLKECPPDLLITRTYVSGMPGHDAAKYLRNKCRGMRVLITGGLLDDERLRYREALEGFDVFPKPYTAAELVEKVKGVLG